jgi:hypothetical protein
VGRVPGVLEHDILDGDEAQPAATGGLVDERSGLPASTAPSTTSSFLT